MSEIKDHTLKLVIEGLWIHGRNKDARLLEKVDAQLAALKEENEATEKENQILKASNADILREGEQIRQKLEKQMEISRVLSEGNAAIADTALDFERTVYRQGDAIKSLKEENERLKAAKSEPVLYQYRMRPTWDKEAKFQDDWILCSQAKYAQYQAQQVYGDWEYQSRALYSSDPDLDAIKARVAEQSAYILRLRKAIIDATNSGAQLDSGTWVYSIDDSVLEWPDALKEPANEG